MSDKLASVRVRSWLDGAINNSQVLIDVRPGDGAKFSGLAAGETIYIQEGASFEDVEFVSVSVDQLTVIRGGSPLPFSDQADVWVFNDYNLPFAQDGRFALLDDIQAVQDQLDDPEFGIDVVPAFYRGSYGVSQIHGNAVNSDFGITVIVTHGTASAVTPAIGDQVSSTPRRSAATVVSPASPLQAGHGANNVYLTRGTVAGLGGFRAGMTVVGPHGASNTDADPSFTRRSCGLVPDASLHSIQFVNPSTLLNIFLFGWDDTDAAGGTWKLFHNDGAGAASMVDTGVARNSDDLFGMRWWCDPAAASMFARITNLRSGQTSGRLEITTNLPSPSIYLEMGQWIANAGTTGTQLAAQYHKMFYSLGPFA